MAIQKVRCPHCRREIPDLAQELQALREENAKLQKQVRSLKSEIEYLGGTTYVASEKRPKFHRLDCKYAEHLRDSPNRIEFLSHRDAVAAGKKPCGTCCA